MQGKWKPGLHLLLQLHTNIRELGTVEQCHPKKNSASSQRCCWHWGIRLLPSEIPKATTHTTSFTFTVLIASIFLSKHTVDKVCPSTGSPPWRPWPAQAAEARRLPRGSSGAGVERFARIGPAERSSFSGPNRTPQEAYSTGSLSPHVLVSPRPWNWWLTLSIRG